MPIEAARGEIVDRNGNPLVTNRQANSIILDAAYFPSGRENEARNTIILNLISLFEKNGEEYVNNLPLRLGSGGGVEFTEDEDDVEAMKSPDMFDLQSYATPQNCFDAMVEKYGLEGRTIVGDMCDLDMFDDSSFDYVFIPHSINFISSLSKLYSEVVRVLKDGGHFLFGCANPVLYIFDEKKEMRGKLKVKYTLPFSDERSRGKKEKERMIREKDTFESSHTLSSIMSPLFEKGMVLVDFYSDESLNETVDSFIHDSFLAFNYVKTRL